MSWTRPHLTRCSGLHRVCGSCMERCTSPDISDGSPGAKSKFARKRSITRSDRREVVSNATVAIISSNRIDFDSNEINPRCHWSFHSPTLRLPCGGLLQQSVAPIQVVCTFTHSGELITALLPLCLALRSPVRVSLYPLTMGLLRN